MPKQVFLACFEALVARFGAPKIPKCLENGLFWDQKKGSKMCFSENTPGAFGVPKQVKCAYFQPIVRIYWAPLK